MNALKTARPVPTHASIASLGSSALYGNCAERVKRDIGLRGKQRARDRIQYGNNTITTLGNDSGLFGGYEIKKVI